MKKINVVEIEDPYRRGRPVVRWKDKVKEYMYERKADRGKGLAQARRKCMYRKRWRFFYRGHPLLGTFVEGICHQKL